MESGYSIVDGGFVGVMVGFVHPTHSACTVAPMEVAWEVGFGCVVFSLDYRVDYHADVFLTVHRKRSLFELGEFMSPAH